MVERWPIMLLLLLVLPSIRVSAAVMMMFDGISVGSGTFSHLPPSNVAGLAVVLGALEGGALA